VQGVAKEWTGVDMSTPLLPEVVPEIDANPVNFYWGGGGVCNCCGSVGFPSKRLGLQFVLIYFVVLLRTSQALQFQTAFLLIHSIFHAIVDDIFNF